VALENNENNNWVRSFARPPCCDVLCGNGDVSSTTKVFELKRIKW
jgi:hypothetical protein